MGRLAGIIRHILTAAAILLPGMQPLSATSPIKQPEQDIWPHAPQVNRLHEVTMPSPDLATGAVNLSIPIYDLQVEDLTIPIALRYRSNGIRVGDDPYPVGYGWTFTPALKITRQVLGRPDGQYQFAGDRTASSMTHAELHRAMVAAHAIDRSRALDLEKDVFTIQMPDVSFSGILQDGVIKVPGHSEYLVVPSSDMKSLTVTDPFGRKWLFAEKGSTLPPYGEILEWGLTSVTFPSGRKMTFEWTYGKHGAFSSGAYHAYDAFYPLNVSSRCPLHEEMSGDRNIDSGPQQLSLNLKAIRFPGGEVILNYNGSGSFTTLRNIKILSLSESGTRSQVHTMDLTYGPAPSSDTMLQSVTIDGDQKYSFEYNPETFGANDTCDLWGYYNRGATGQSSAPSVRLTEPNAPSPIIIPGSDRFPDSNHMKARILTKVTYPTGGILELEYEPHRFAEEEFYDALEMNGNQSRKLSFGGGLRLSKSILRKDSQDLDPQWVEYVYGEGGNGLATADALPLASTFLTKSILVWPYEGNGAAVYEHGMVTANLYSSVFNYRFGEELIWYHEVSEVYPEGSVTHRFDKLAENEVWCNGLNGAIPISVGTMFANPLVETEKCVYSSAKTGSRLLEKTVLDYHQSYDGSVINGMIAIRKRLRSGFGSSESLPDFSEGLSVGDLDQEDFHARSYSYNDGDIYEPHNYVIEPYVIRIASKEVTQYTETGPITTLEEYTYKNGTGLLTKKKLSNSTESIESRYTYNSSDNIGNAMRDAHVLGVVTQVQELYRGNIISVTKASYGKPVSSKVMFRPLRITSGRTASLQNTVRTYRWNSTGDLIWSADRAGVSTEWTWDSHGRYPLTQKSGGKLLSKAEWKPLVGVSALTETDGVRSDFGYDEAGRLSDVTWAGTLKDTYEYKISQTGSNTVTTRHFTDLTQYAQTRSVIDGLGREHMSMTSQDKGWSVELTDYDNMGRVRRRWAPTNATLSSMTDQNVRNSAMSRFHTSYPYTDVRYEDSPRGIETGSVKAGDRWHSAGKEVKVEYLANTVDGDCSCPSYVLTSTGVRQNGIKTPGTVTVRKTTDEDGMTVMEFTDLRGLTVCRKQGGAVTSFLYDDYGDLRYILPPGAETAGERTSSVMKDLAYWYDYDVESRLIRKKVPGRQEERTVYDSGNRIAAVRTADHRDGVWRLFFYDGCGREVLVLDAEISDAAADSLSSGLSNAFLDPHGMWKGYRTECAVTLRRNDATIVSARYYDDYSFIDVLNDSSLRFRTPSQAGVPADATGYQGSLTYIRDPYGRLTGLFTGRNVEACYYDSRGLELQRVYNGNDSFTRTTLHTHDGSVHSSYERFRDGRPNRDTRYSYDVNGRLREMLVVESGTRNGTAAADTARIAHAYSDIGRLASRTMGNVVQKLDYDVHGWPLSSSTRIGSLTYSERLYYADDQANIPRYNGFVSRKEWNGHAYDFSYDGNGFLTRANYSELPGNTQATGANTGVFFDYSTSYGYDRRGNLTSVLRKGVVDSQPSGRNTFGNLDEIEIAYTGNRINTIMTTLRLVAASRPTALAGPGLTDVSAMQDLGIEVWNGPTSSDGPAFVLNSYPEYDGAGRITKDPTRGITSVEYDNNGFPVKMSVRGDGADDTVTYTRDGAGVLQKAIYSSGDGTVRTVKYSQAGHETVNGRLTMSRFPGGYFDDRGKALYYLQDYQGNVVRVFEGDGRSCQAMDYYPYGEPWHEWDWARADSTSMCANRRLFGGKERVTQFGLNLYDFTSRHYNASQTRFMTPDPKSESTPWFSPYAYCASNPVNNVDPTGEDIVVLNYGYGLLHQHLAMLIQNEDKKWQYYSINGDKMYTITGHSSGRPFNDIAVGSWDTPQDFLNSSYNIEDDNSQVDKSKNNYGFEEGYQIPSTPEQDKAMRESFRKTAKTEYNLFFNNCATAVQKAMIDAGIPVSEPTMKPSTIPMPTTSGLVDVFNGYKMDCDITMYPSQAYKSIVKWNPDGKHVYKQ